MLNTAAELGLAPTQTSRRGKQSINRKLALIVIASVMAAVAVIAVGSVWQEARRHTRSKLDYVGATAAVFASATSHAVADNDAPAALFALRGVARAPYIQYARVETLDGMRLAEIGSGVLLGTDASFGGGGGQTTLFSALKSRTLEVTEPIVQGGRVVGRITLVADNSDLAPNLAATLVQTLLGALTALAVAVAIAARLQHWVVRPLLRLTDMVRHISQSHDYGARVDIDSDDEVGDLCAGFNAMLGEVKDRERKIIDLARHDSETDLPNRLAFEQEIAERLAKPHPERVIVAAIGVDRFQYVRGVIGYPLACDLLGELGARISYAGDCPMAARISTDVIGFLLEAPDEETARALAGEFLAETEAPMQLGANTIDVNLTIGLAAFGLRADGPQTLIEHANIALDQARAGQSKIAAFDEAAYVTTAGNLSLMTDMARALDNGEMAIALQPKYDIRAGAIGGAEVLVRWRHPTRGMIPPDLFVNMAEETGGIANLSLWVLRAALDAQGRLVEAGVGLPLAVNLSGRLLGDGDFVAAALAMLADAPAHIFLEITETASIDNQDLALRHIDALRAAGASISIDDYGAGLSSLAYLKRIPAQELKIDKAFVQALEHQQRDALLVKSTIDLAHSLGMKVTAEGVETEATLVMLTAMGCDWAQGYFIARPMPEAAFTQFLLQKLAPPRAAAHA